MSEPLRPTRRDPAPFAPLSAGLLLAALAAPLFIGALPSSASAQQSTVLVLGIRSLEGDDEFARNLTGALRHAAAQVDRWTVSDREVTLAQMAMAHGCSDPDAACMGNIAGSLEADYVIYGDVRRTSAGTSFDFSLNLHIYNRASQEIEHSVAETISSVRRDIDDLREPARRYIAALSGAPRAGTLTVLVNVPGAEVFLDEESAGITDGEGHLTVTNVSAGTRNIHIVAQGHQHFRSTVTIEAYGEATFEAELEQGSGGGGDGIPGEAVAGGALLAVGVISAGFWIGAMSYINWGIGYNSDQSAAGVGLEDWGGARAMYPGQDNFCASWRAERPTGTNWVGDLCDEYDTWFALQFVFLGVAAVAGGVGTFLLIDGLSGNGESGDTARLQLQLVPSFGMDHASLSLAGRFF
ncbi:MAG: PEGA domain-containing protein [Sandaracinaceae bacterium]